MAVINTVAVDLHVKRYSDFDLLRIAKAVSQDYEGFITAYLVNVHIPCVQRSWCCIWPYPCLGESAILGWPAD